MKMVNTMRMLENNKHKARAIVLVLSGTLLASVIGAAPSHAVIAVSSNHSAKTMTMAEYKVEYVAWLAATKAWNATRVQQVADHLVARADYKKAAVASQLAIKAILATRTTALAAARQTYLDQAATSTNPVLRARFLSVRTTAYAVIIAAAVVQMEALPVLGLKPTWPVAAPRPIKPVKPAIV